jgi:hypothetical protein
MEEYSQSSSENSTDLQADNIHQNPEYHRFFLQIKMASQGSQSSQDFKDEPGNVKLVDTLMKLASEYAKEAADKDSKDAQELYDDKFVPWIKKAVRSGLVVPGKRQQIHITLIIGNGFPKKVVWEKMRVLAADDNIQVGPLETDCHESWTVWVWFNMT